MIDYSVYIQANPMKPEESAKAYAKAQMSELMTFAKFVKHISNHNGVYSRGTVRGVLLDMCECLVEMLLEGKKVQLGEFGNFWISLESKGAESATAFTADNISGVNIVFTPGEDFENLRQRAEFNVVSSRKAQALMLKAEKEGQENVSLEEILSETRKNAAAAGDETQEP
jgi:predicted histone-like DNA-binding protein